MYSKYGNDYDIIHKIKNGINTEKNKYKLYLKYMPLIHKYARKFNRWMRTDMYEEDYIQESYFYIEKVVNWVDLDKIENPDNFYIVFALKNNLVMLMKSMVNKYFKNLNNGSIVCENDEVKFVPHQIKSQKMEDDQFDPIDNSICYNNISIEYHEKAYEILHDYIYHHDKIVKNPIVIRDNGVLKKETPMRDWQLRYSKMILEGKPIKEIEKEVKVTKQRWYQTRSHLKKFIQERINRSVDLNIMSV